MSFDASSPFTSSTAPEILSLPFRGPALLARHGWRLNNLPEAKRPKIEQDSERGLVLETNNEGDTYLIHNGSSGEFRQLKPGSGFPMPSGSSLHLKSGVILDGPERASILILEFDKEGQYVGKTRLPVNCSVTYAPPGGADRVMLTLMIHGSGRAVIQNVSVHPVANLPVPLDGPALLTRHGWRLNNLPEAKRPKIEQDSEGSLNLHIETDGDTYLLHNGSSGEFKQLKPGSGIITPSGSSFNLDSDIVLDGPSRATILILEFDEQGLRVGKTRLPINCPTTYAPPCGVERVMLTVMIQGAGRAVVRTLTVQPLSAVQVPFDGPDLLTRHGWRLNNRAEATRPRIGQDNEGALVLHIESDRDTYLIHNGSSGEFKKLKPGSGFVMPSGSSLHLNSQVVLEGPARASILILEFDEEGRHLGKTRLPINSPVMYAPRPGAERVLLTLMIHGSGRAIIQNLSVHPSGASALGSAGAPMGLPTNLTHWILSTLATSLPVSNGSSYGANIPLSVAIVTDEFMYNFYRGAFAELHYLSPTNFEEVLSTHKIDAFLYVTCWRGLHDEEWRGVRHRERPASALRGIIGHCRANKITTIFQSIEDPSNFENFIEIAKMFDCVFTADADIIPSYRERVGHDRVFYGEYGANPVLNNPIGCRRPAINGAFFAGSYPTRYAERCHDMETIFTSLVNSGAPLVIADRNLGGGSADLIYPERWWPYVIPKFAHETLQAVHKLFRYNINLNSIKHSSTMCAMRVYELQAQGRPLISNYARSTYNRFPNVITVPHQTSMTALFRPESLEDYRSAMAGAREVLTGLTNVDVAGRMMARAGFPSAEIPPRTIAVIADELSTATRRCFAAQSYPAKVLLDAASVRDPRAWKEARQRHDVAFFCFFSADDEYEPGYLSDLVNAFKYTASKYVAKVCWFDGKSLQEGPEHEFITEMPGRARTMFEASSFEPADLLRLGAHETANMPGGYAIDPFELNYRCFLKAQRQESTEAALSVVIPVFNNGRFLTTKCMPSLMRNALWPRMEVILVDDGSTDTETKEHCTYLRDAYSNVQLFEFDDSGSGSASRPRNKGVELATAPLVAFLDPDNEISPGGYDTLVEIYEEFAAQGRGVPFVSGYQVKVGEKMAVTGHHTSEAIELVEDLHERFFGRGRFPVISTQAAVIDRSLLDRTGLRFVEGAAGQDTLYGWELLAHAKRGAFTSDAFLLYYAERAGSITNAISADYFRKKLVLELEQRNRLEFLGLLEAYVEHHLETFFRQWYLPKLAEVRPQEREQATAILSRIVDIYGRGDLMAEQHEIAK
jgi:glycosyltransferase involved in cell wall biosynthesis